jgi:Na+/H+ antiporter NhaC
MVYVLLLVLFSSPVAAQDDPSPYFSHWQSILPPLAAIALALLFKRVIPALFLGLWLGTWLLEGLSLGGLWAGMLDTFQVYVLKALANEDHAAVILFTLMIGGMVGIISRNGGLQGIVNFIVRRADSARHSTLATALMGVAIFFDDYANTLIVGNTMRPVTDAMRVSREKLAYLVDSTAAPVACIALVTTWVGYEVGLIGDAMTSIDTLDIPPYWVYLNTIGYSFYPILALVFVFMVALSGRDFGPMLKAEQRARRRSVGEEKAHRPASGDEDHAPIPCVENKPQRAINALLPIAVLVFGVVVSLYVTGRSAVDDPQATLREIIGAADSYKSLMWASLLGVVTAAALSLGQRILDLEEVVASWYRGLRAMIYATIILLLAWGLGEVTGLLGTAEFLVSMLGDTLPAWWLPTLVFLLAAATGFGTGSSWGAMAILVPLVVPLTWAIMESQGISGEAEMHLLYSSIAAVLAGSVWGDHCSPISDTTILSSMSSGCDHVEHVRTQMPYALLVGGVSIVCGSLPVALGLPWWAGLLAGCVLLWLTLRLLGKHSD